MKDQKTPTLDEARKNELFRRFEEKIGDFWFVCGKHKSSFIEVAQEYAQTISEGKDREIEELKGMLQSCVHQSERLGILQNDLIEEITAALNKGH